MPRFCRPLMLAAALAVIVPATAAAQDARVVVREVPLAAARASTARPAPVRFDMVGIHWQGPGLVEFRVAARPGRFGRWHSAQPEGEDAPDTGNAELSASAGWHVGNPWWTGEARWIEYRIRGSVTRIRTYFVNSPVTAADIARTSSARTAAAGLAALAGPVARPPIVSRAGWNADESIVRAEPLIAQRLRFAVVHHTAGSNSYSAAESAAIVRGIERYHVLSNGWNDIGYNFLVDKYGRVFEGRGGGMTRNVVGAHAGGFNTGSVGVAVIGNYDSAGLSTAARKALKKLLAWRLDVGHVDPRGSVDAVSGGNERFPAGVHVHLRAVSGHRDTGSTSCPGSKIYSQLGTIARKVKRFGLPKLWDPEAQGSVGGPVRFTGRLSGARNWTVDVKDGTGTVVASGTGTGTAVDWMWDASAVPIVYYTYTISAGADVRPSTLPVPGPPPLAITGLKATPKALTPNGDWSGERTSIRFGLTRRASLAVRVVNKSTGALVRTLLASAVRPAGALSLSWDGTTAGGAAVPDGRYRIELSAQDGPEQVSRSKSLVVDRTLGGMFVAPTVFSPNGDGRLDTVHIGYELTRAAAVQVRVRRDGKVVRTVSQASQAAGAHGVEWNGKLGKGKRKRLGDGPASMVVVATTSLGNRRLYRPIVLDTRRPVARVLELKRVNGAARLRFWLSEPARMRIWFGRDSWRDGVEVSVTRGAGTHVLRRHLPAGVVRIVATDEALNRGAPVVHRRR